MPEKWNLLPLHTTIKLSGRQGTILDYWKQHNEIVGYVVEMEVEEADLQEAESKLIKKTVITALDEPGLEVLGP